MTALWTAAAWPGLNWSRHGDGLFNGFGDGTGHSPNGSGYGHGYGYGAECGDGFGDGFSGGWDPVNNGSDDGYGKGFPEQDYDGHTAISRMQIYEATLPANDLLTLAVTR